jgi:hypothetical protein
MSGPHQPALAEVRDFSKLLEFLYKIVEDTQATIRFIDTKAAFCLTLLSGMVAAALQVPHLRTHPHRVLFGVFVATVALALLVCLRVIFPTIRSRGVQQAASVPHFFIGHSRRHQWILHTLRNRVDGVLSETADTYLAKIIVARELDLVSSMCDEVLMISLIRQVKSDRLHAAMLCVFAALLLFLALMIA